MFWFTLCRLTFDLLGFVVAVWLCWRIFRRREEYDLTLPVMCECSVGSTCRDSLKAWASAVTLFAVIMFIWTVISNREVNVCVTTHMYTSVWVFMCVLTCDTCWRILQLSAQSPPPAAPTSPATSAAGWRRLHPWPAHGINHNNTKHTRWRFTHVVKPSDRIAYVSLCVFVRWGVVYVSDAHVCTFVCVQRTYMCIPQNLRLILIFHCFGCQHRRVGAGH